MGRFTIRDEGKTIALGKVTKYKPVKVNILSTNQSTTSQEEVKKDNQITQSVSGQSSGSQTSSQNDLVYDMETGETVTKEEYQRR
jgi:hypothetical protein